MAGVSVWWSQSHVLCWPLSCVWIPFLMKSTLRIHKTQTSMYIFLRELAIWKTEHSWNSPLLLLWHGEIGLPTVEAGHKQQCTWNCVTAFITKCWYHFTTNSTYFTSTQGQCTCHLGRYSKNGESLAESRASTHRATDSITVANTYLNHKSDTRFVKRRRSSYSSRPKRVGSCRKSRGYLGRLKIESASSTTVECWSVMPRMTLSCTCT